MKGVGFRTETARDVVERGHAVVGELLAKDDVRRVRGALERFVDRVAPPALHSPTHVPLPRPDLPGPLALGSVGLIVPCLMELVPDSMQLVSSARLASPIRELLGRDARLEAFGAVVSDHDRPFFAWHTHIDGEDEGVRVARSVWPPKERLERVLVLVYLQDLDDETGPLLVLPRRLGEATAPPHDLHDPSWPGQVELRLRAGDAVLLEQCTWHAVRPQARAGLRMFLAGYFTTRDAPPAAWANDHVDRAWRSSS